MSTLPASIAIYIPTSLHADAATALASHIEQIVGSRVKEEREQLLRNIVAAALSWELPRPGGVEVPRQAPTTDSRYQNNRIVAGSVGVLHESFVASFRAEFPTLERTMREYVAALPPGSRIPRTVYDGWRESMGARGRVRVRRLPAMLRECGCTEVDTGVWRTPVLRVVEREA